jgi:hypothetical protein
MIFVQQTPGDVEVAFRPKQRRLRVATSVHISLSPPRIGQFTAMQQTLATDQSRIEFRLDLARKSGRVYVTHCLRSQNGDS